MPTAHHVVPGAHRVIPAAHHVIPATKGKPPMARRGIGQRAQNARLEYLRQEEFRAFLLRVVEYLIRRPLLDDVP